MSRVHGSAADRGSADAYYRRPARPHFNMLMPNGSMLRVGRGGMTEEMIQEYITAYDKEEDRKDYG